MRGCISRIGIAALTAVMVTLWAHSGHAQNETDPERERFLEQVRSTVGPHLDDGYRIDHYSFSLVGVTFILRKNKHHVYCHSHVWTAGMWTEDADFICITLNQRSYD